MKKIILTLALFLGFTITLNAEPYVATAYCHTGKTASGRQAGYGVIAVDPRIIKLGSKVKINGKTYVAADTGGVIKGRKIDIWMSCSEAKQFGRRKVDLQIL